MLEKVEWKSLGELAMSNLTYGSSSSAVNYNGAVRYIRITDISDTGNLNDDKKSPSEIDEKYILNDGDVLFARSGATVGKTFRYKSSYWKSIYAWYLIRFVANPYKVLPDYVYHFTKTKYYNDFIEKNKSTWSQPNINAKQYSSMRIPIPMKNGKPDLEKQQKIVAILDKFDTLVNDLSTGLPAELEARRKQYEYYRNQLLTFTPLKE